MEKQIANENIFVRWEKPHRFAIVLFNTDRMRGDHISIGVLSTSIDKAILAAQKAYPNYRIERVNDSGAIDIIVED